MASHHLHPVFMADSEKSSLKLRFHDLVFLAGPASPTCNNNMIQNQHLLPSTECSVIHFEACGFHSSDFEEEEKYCEMYPLSKILWCINAKTGECIDWSKEDELSSCTQRSLHHCVSFKSGLCNQNLAKRLIVSRSSDWSNRVDMNAVTRYPSSFREIIEWKAIQEAEILAKLPRYTDSALEALHTCAVPRIITECKVSDKTGSYHHVISHVNEPWEKLCGHKREEVVGESLNFLHGPDTDPDVQRALGDAITDALDVSVLIKNYKKNGETFMNRARVIPVIDRGSQTTAGDRPTRFMASLAAAAPCSVESDAALFGDWGRVSPTLPVMSPRDLGTPQSLEF